MFKPPKMSSNQPSNLSAPPEAPATSFNDFSPAPAVEPLKQEVASDFSPDISEEARVWSPSSEPPVEAPIESQATEELIPEPVQETVEDQPAVETEAKYERPVEVVAEETVEMPMSTPETEELVTDPENEVSIPENNTDVDQEPAQAPNMSLDAPMQPVPAAAPAIPVMDEKLRYARPTEQNNSATFNPQPAPPVAEPLPQAELENVATVSATIINEETDEKNSESISVSETDETIQRLLGKDQKVIHAKSIRDIPFSDIWYTAENIAYIRDTSTKFALIPFVPEDLDDFFKTLEQGYTGQSSYAIRFAGEQYRVERVITLSGPQYNCRKMPGTVPDIYTLGLPKHVVDYLLTLSHESGLLLFGGPTGMGKTTSASALMKKFLEMEGGFMYTIEDPPEMPLDGLYHAANGGLGMCKQCPVDNERWGDGIKSALRSRPRYILVGEIRTPETASQVLRAATSGHLVLSTVHASTVEDALESVIKYASGAGLTESLAADLLARGILGVIHQKLEGVETLRPVITSAFANPHLTGGDQMRSLIRNQTINLQTLVEAQSSRLFQGRPLFDAVSTEQ